MKKTEKTLAKYINIFVIIFSSILRLWYVLYTDIGSRQHDLGYATFLNDGLVNPGHLGYIEYIAKFRQLPDFNPFSVFSYYHPPVHHIIAALFVRMAHNIGISEPAIFEAAQIPTLIYSILTVIIAYKTVKLLCADEKKLIIPLILIAFHPGLIYMTGSIGNDMMATMMLFLTAYLSFLWIQSDYKPLYLFLMAFFIGIGMLVKINVVIISAPIAAVMIFHLVQSVKNRNFFHCLKNYIIFAFIAIPIGLAWSVRNFIVFNVTPGISSANPDSIQYMGNYSLWQRLGIPESSMLHSLFMQKVLLTATMYGKYFLKLHFLLKYGLRIFQKLYLYSVR